MESAPARYPTAKRLLAISLLAVGHLIVSQAVLVAVFVLGHLLTDNAKRVAEVMSWVFFFPVQLADAIWPKWDKTGQFDGLVMVLNGLLYGAAYFGCYRLWRAARRRTEPR
jgi:hypothetical protein